MNEKENLLKNDIYNQKEKTTKVNTTRHHKAHDLPHPTSASHTQYQIIECVCEHFIVLLKTRPSEHIWSNVSCEWK